jgi:hypothetical protein
MAHGWLSARGAIEAGSNDFELVLSPTPPCESLTVDAIVAVMPNHGHRAVPGYVEATDTGYRVVNLQLPMAGAWQLRADLRVDERADAISFQIDVR